MRESEYEIIRVIKPLIRAKGNPKRGRRPLRRTASPQEPSTGARMMALKRLCYLVYKIIRYMRIYKLLLDVEFF